MRQGVSVPRSAVTPTAGLGLNGRREEQREITLKMQFGKGVESCAWRVKELTVLMQKSNKIRTGLLKD